jgi:hypothetical protein
MFILFACMLLVRHLLNMFVRHPDVMLSGSECEGQMLICPTSLQDDSDVWVTVFGFQPGQLHLIMKEFAKCGDIVHFGNGRETMQIGCT